MKLIMFVKITSHGPVCRHNFWTPRFLVAITLLLIHTDFRTLLRIYSEKYLRDVQPPLMEVDLHQIPPLLSVRCFPSPCSSQPLLDIFPLPSFWSSPRSLSVSDLPLCASDSPSIIFIRASCHANLNFSLVISSTTSFTFVFSLISRFWILSISFIPNIFLSIFLWQISTFWMISLFSVQVWHPYVLYLL